jgi:hypothetical protein
MVATPFLKRRQQVLKPRDSPEILIKPKPSSSLERGQYRRNRQLGEGSSVRPGSQTGAKAQDGSPGNLRDPAHVHVRASRQLGRRLNMDPGPEGTLRPSGSASASCETRTEEGSVDPGSETNK